MRGRDPMPMTDDWGKLNRLLGQVEAATKDWQVAPARLLVALGAAWEANDVGLGVVVVPALEELRAAWAEAQAVGDT
ncbi:MAG: hypothetical protein DMD33_18555 [Gemmatimonadetes bacterium]|nr:MAG: hypothetical protein DMD33_18555 [Gemmatimonadota bacterium]